MFGCQGREKGRKGNEKKVEEEEEQRIDSTQARVILLSEGKRNEKSPLWISVKETRIEINYRNGLGF